MLEQLIHIDHQLLHFINESLSNAFFDWLMPYFRNKLFWIPLYAVLLFFLIKKYGKKTWLICLFLIAGVVTSDQVSSGLLKPFFNRNRPCAAFNDDAQLHELINCSNGKSFPSSHASNHFFVSVFLIGFLGERRLYAFLLIVWASLVCFAQVYVGVHYPADVFAGAVLGGFIAVLFYKLYLFIQNKTKLSL